MATTQENWSFDLHLEPDAELQPMDTAPFDVSEIRKCKVATTITHAQLGSYSCQNACLVVLNFDFVAAYQIRFKYVELVVRLVKLKGNIAGAGQEVNDRPEIIAYEPKRWQGARHSRQVQRNVGSDITATAPAVGGVSTSLGFVAARSIQFEEHQRASLSSVSETPTKVEWRLSENECTHEGVPNPLRTAMIVRCGTAFAIKIGYQINLSKSINPASWRRAYARTSKAKEFDFSVMGSGFGPPVIGVDEMSREDFKLDSLVTKEWDL